METVHGTTVAVEGRGVLLRGPSGSGKSDLALRLIDGGGTLVADDRTIVEQQGAQLYARAPETLRGLLEVRGVGIVRISSQPTVALALLVDLGAPPVRLPEAETATLLDVSLPLLRLSAFESSASAKIRLAVRISPDDIVR